MVMLLYKVVNTDTSNYESNVVILLKRELPFTLNVPLMVALSKPDTFNDEVMS